MIDGFQKLDREFYSTNALATARKLLGKELVRVSDEGVTSGIIVETEAYMGAIDPGAHSYQNRRTRRTEVMFGSGGFAYVYMIYGMYFCMNVTVNAPGIPEAVLIRALEPSKGTELMMQRRKTDKLLQLCSGPGKLCVALDIRKDCNSLDLCGDTLFLAEGPEPDRITTAKRINIDYAGEAKDYPWRFLVSDCKYVSRSPK